MSGRMKLVIDRCPLHGVMAISIGEDFGSTRITPSKCCGQWMTVHEFELSAREWRELSDFATEAADTTERGADGEARA